MQSCGCAQNRAKVCCRKFWNFNLHSGTGRHGKEEMSSKMGIDETVDGRKGW